MHLTAVQEANRRFDAGEYPAMMQRVGGNYEYFEDIVEAVFAAPDRQTAKNIVDSYSSYWMQIKGTRGFAGLNAMNARTQFSRLFTFEDTDPDSLDQSKLLNLESSL